MATSDALIRRDALAISGVAIPTPEQNNFNPPPEPVASTTGVLKSVDLPNRSATVVVKGNTVEEPTMRIWSRSAKAGQAVSVKIRAVRVLRSMGWVLWLGVGGYIAWFWRGCHGFFKGMISFFRERT